MTKPTISDRKDSMNKSKVYHAIFETPDFTVESYGASEEQARKLLAEAWKFESDSIRKHEPRSKYADPGYLERYAEDIEMRRVTVGSIYLDGHVRDTVTGKRVE